METFGWWLLEFVAVRAMVRTAAGLVPAMLGLLLGKRYRSLRDDFKTIERYPGRGDAAARLIRRAPDFQRAVRVFNDCRYAERVVEGERLYTAMTARMRSEGPTPDTLDFLADENIEGTPEGTEYERLERFEWMIARFEDKLRSA